jgi:hypothetical protein
MAQPFNRDLLQQQADAWSERNKQGYDTMKTVLGMMPVVGAPVAGLAAYDAFKEGDYLGGGLNTAAGLLGAASIPSALRSGATQYARSTMPLRSAQMNMEATSPSMLQGANFSPKGQLLSDMRFNEALKGASGKGLTMANSPVTKTQGVWVDPASNVEEFNRVYAQNIGRIPATPIQENPAVAAYANSMGGDLGQWGVGASRFSPLPFNVNKQSANAVLYPKASAKDIINAGKKLNPKGGVVSATPQGGMIVFNPEGSMTAEQITKNIKGVSSKPKFGLLDSAYFDTSAQPQGAYMSNIDKLIKKSGY